MVFFEEFKKHMSLLIVMGDEIFKGMLKADESLIRDDVPLDYSFMPKKVPFREAKQGYIANCIKPLFSKRNGKNLFIYGKPGIGKTLLCRHVLNALGEEDVGEEVIPIYINCWQKNTNFKIMTEICRILDYKFVQNKRSEELFDIAKQMLNKKSVVFCFDEVDKIENMDLVYHILEEIYRKTIIFITNHKVFLDKIDDRLKSRLMLDLLEFKPYNLQETKGILKERIKYAFVTDVWKDDAFEAIIKKTAENEDIRTGLFMVKEAGRIAEDRSSRKIELEDAQAAIKKAEEVSIRSSDDLEDETKSILTIIKNNTGKKMGDLYKIYQDAGGQQVYKTFARKIKKLEDSKFVECKKTEGGTEGNVTFVNYVKMKKLDEF